MDADAIVGTILIVVALVTVSYLTFWSRRTINRIARNGSRTARQIAKELNGDK